MHRCVISASTRDRLLRQQGRLTTRASLDAARTTLLVIDMQNYFVAEGFPGEVPLARAIVPTINRLAKAVRAAGATVVWVRTTAGGPPEHWYNYHNDMLTPERAAKRLESLAESSEGFRFYPALDVEPRDLTVKKIKYSAFIAGSSDIDTQLKRRGINTLLIAGTATNVCCESSARDAMMLGYRIIMLSDATATWTDKEHVATLENILRFFGDVMATDDVIAQLAPAENRSTG
jgi:ureidoacrylate peracid hydrolase